MMENAKDLEAHAEAILRAAGSSLKHYTMPGTREAILAAVRDAMGEWKPIETAPKDGRFIIAYDPQVGVSQIWWCDVFGRWESLNNDYAMRDCVDERHYIFEAKPTHWHPLPLSPAA